MRRVVILVIRRLDLGIKIHGLDGSYFLDGFACSLEKNGWKILKARSFGSKIKNSLTYGKFLFTEWIRQKSKLISWSRRFNRSRKVRKNLEKFIYFREIFDKYNPLKVIACVPDPMLCLAAGMRGIEIVEISHAYGIPEQGEGYTKKEFMAKNRRIKPKKNNNLRWHNLCFNKKK